MPDYVIAPPPIPSLPVASTDERFPVRRIFCVGRNYAAHAREMGADPDRESPMIFTKPADAIVAAVGTLPYPTLTADLHHEVEMVIALKQGGVNIDPASAAELIWGYGVGLDLTRRDLQAHAKENRHPWDMAKGFDSSAACTALRSLTETGQLKSGRIWLETNGEMRQESDLIDMIWSTSEIIAYISRAVALAPGDLIYTGTPSGVGPLAPGDRVRGGVDGLAEFELTVGPQPEK
ncbi:fumarylacetoacetate hydrolase family protein [Rhodococcus sp. NPDC056960]|uniref:fumarylacetoacetate hydrolase family protein n=1 Tax=Rhodococcus sp. NPDC056960 TaxID=3345982 RepID=UPI00362A065D